MADSRSQLAAGLYLVATPIGAARDMTLRALDILATADLLAAEDTRTTRRLLDIHGVKLGGRLLMPYHDHNGAAQRPKLLAAIAAGQSVACVSDAGTPLVADPGYVLARETIAAGHAVWAAPGASAVLAALSVSGLPSDRFFFAGFLPPKTVARRKTLREMAAIPGTQIIFESPRRLDGTLTDMVKEWGGDRPAAVCRELTKKFEETRRGSLAVLAEHYSSQSAPKGEIVIVVGPPADAAVSDDGLSAALLDALETMSLKDAVAQVSTDLDAPRKRVYQLALLLRQAK